MQHLPGRSGLNRLPGCYPPRHFVTGYQMSFCPHSREMKNARVLCLFACNLRLLYITARSWTQHRHRELILRTVFPTPRFPGSPGTSHLCLRDSDFVDCSTGAPEKHCSETTWVIEGNKTVFHIFILNSQGLPSWEVHLVPLQRRLDPNLEVAQRQWPLCCRGLPAPTPPGTKPSNKPSEPYNPLSSCFLPSRSSRSQTQPSSKPAMHTRDTTLLQQHPHPPPPQRSPREESSNTLPSPADEPHAQTSHLSFGAQAAALHMLFKVDTKQVTPHQPATAWPKHHSSPQLFTCFPWGLANHPQLRPPWWQGQRVCCRGAACPPCPPPQCLLPCSATGRSFKAHRQGLGWCSKGQLAPGHPLSPGSYLRPAWQTVLVFITFQITMSVCRSAVLQGRVASLWVLFV